MTEHEAERSVADVIGEHLERVEGLVWWRDDAARFSVTCPCDDGLLHLRVRCTDHHVLLFAPQLATAPKRGKTGVFEHLMSLHWNTMLPKFEWDRRDGELRAMWCLPTDAGPPSYEQFEQTLREFVQAVGRARPALCDVVKKAERSLSAEAADRIPEAAELSNLGRNLVALASEREILPMYVREDLVETVISALGGPRQQLLLVGEPGTGKNAVVHALATWIAAGDPRVERGGLQDRHIYECVPASFQASVMYVHELENKIQLIAENCVEQNAILFLDEAHLAVTAASTSDDHARTIANLLLPFLSRNEITVIGATDPNGLKAMERLNQRFTDAFHLVEVPEPGRDETLHMIRDRLARFAAGEVSQRAFEFDEGVDTRLLELSGRFLRTRKYPGKALELLDRVAADCSADPTRDRIMLADVDATVSRMSGLRPEIVCGETPLGRSEIETALRAGVIGQEDAVRAVCDVVIAYKSEMSPPGRPIGTLFFAGPTGVGKTQLARTLAEYLFGTEEALLRYDMSEFADLDGASKLCGRRGHGGEPGRLVQDVNAKPFSVILFDEIEKAHVNVFNVLLQVLGEGRMTDETGRTASFLNSIIIMTSNVGAQLFGAGALGFAQSGLREVSTEAMQKELEGFFRPEFLNRLSHVVCFQPLDRQQIREIARREIRGLAAREGLQQRRIEVEVSDAMVDRLVEVGFSERYGARAMQRAVETLIAGPIAEMLAQTPGLADGAVVVDWQDGRACARVG